MEETSQRIYWPDMAKRPWMMRRQNRYLMVGQVQGVNPSDWCSVLTVGKVTKSQRQQAKTNLEWEQYST